MNAVLLIAHAPLANALRQGALHVFSDAAADIAALDVRALGGGAFLVSGWVLTAADLAGLGVDPAAVSGIASGAAGTAHRAL